MNMPNSGIPRESFLQVPGLEDALKRNLELQKQYPDKIAGTNIDDDTKTVNIQVCNSGLIERNGLGLDSKPGLEVALRFFVTREKDFQFWERFQNSPLSKSFKVNDLKIDGQALKECYLDLGEDVQGATKLIASILTSVYGLDETASIICKTWSHGESTPIKENDSLDEDFQPGIGKNGGTTGRLDYGGGYYYIGEIKDGMANGEGTTYNPDGKISEEGTFKDDKLDGFGTIYVDGNKFYEGEFVNGERSGKGKEYVLGKLQYEGDYSHDKRNGVGTEWLPVDNSMSMYVGEYKDDKRTGKGTLYYDGVKMYEGDFVDGQFHGNGTIYGETGNVLYSGVFEHNKLPEETYPLKGNMETYPLKGNKWVSITSSNGATYAESYKLTFNLPPHIKGIKDTLELFVRHITNPAKQVSFLAIYARFVSKGTAFVLGGGPVFLDDGKMTIRINAKKDITIKPVKVAMNVGVATEETVAYPLEKDEFREICDADNLEIELTAGSVYEDWRQKLTGDNILFLMRASWNGIINENDYLNELQHSPATSNIKIVILNAALEVIFGILCLVAWDSVFLFILFIGVGLYDLIKKNTGIFKYFIK